MTLAGTTLDWEWEEAELDPPESPPSPPRTLARRRRGASALALGVSLTVVGAAMAWNLQGYPGRVNNDEGTYMARAWAMLYTHHLSNYTYFWDHPFLAWAQIAGWVRLTDGFAWVARSLMIGRDLMWVVTMITGALVFLLARRIGMSRVASAAAVLLFGLSPLAIWYHRLVFLDNFSTMWAVAAFAAAATWRRSLSAVTGAAIFFAAATWSKETVALLLPALLWLLAQHTQRRARVKYLLVFCMVYGGLIGLWPLLAAVKGELLPGTGHVSMLGETFYQLATRPGTGTILHYGSGTWVQVSLWVRLDRWLAYAGTAAVLPGLLIRRYRPFAVALIVLMLYLVKGGYVPYAFVTVMVPFWALLLTGVPDSLWGTGGQGQGRGWALAGRWARRLPVIAAALVVLVAVAPRWFGSLRASASVNGFATQDAAVAWVARNVPAGDVVVCDDYPWVDLKVRTRALPVSLWQIDSDPSVMHLMPHGYSDISYLVLDPSSPLMFAAIPGRPTLRDAIHHSRVIQRFGTIRVYRIDSPGPGGSRRGPAPAGSRGAEAGHHGSPGPALAPGHDHAGQAAQRGGQPGGVNWRGAAGGRLVR